MENSYNKKRILDSIKCYLPACYPRLDYDSPSCWSLNRFHKLAFEGFDATEYEIADFDETENEIADFDETENDFSHFINFDETEYKITKREKKNEIVGTIGTEGRNQFLKIGLIMMVLDAILGLIYEKDTYPDGELGSVERCALANKYHALAKKYRALDKKYRAAVPKYGTVPVPPKLSPSQASNCTGGCHFVIYNVIGDRNVFGNDIQATNSNRVGIFGSFNEGPNPKKAKLSWVFWWQN